MTPDQISARVFGRRVRLSRGYSSGHDGLDFAAAGGTPVAAAASGTIRYAGNAALDPRARAYWAEGGGNVVEIDHGGGIWTQYAHLRSVRPELRVGGRISAGTTLGYVGRTGVATGDNLHFGVWDRNRGRMVDPATWSGAGSVTGGATGPVGPVGPKGPQGPTELPFINIKEGKILTIADVDNVILAAFDKAGTFLQGSPIAGLTAREVARGKLLAFVGQPWNKATRDAMQASLFQAATEAGALGTAIGGAIGDATFTLVVLGGIVVLFLIGAYVTVRGGSPTLIVKRAIA